MVDPETSGSNIGRELARLSETQHELQPHILELHADISKVVEIERDSKKPLKAGQEYVTDASTTFWQDDERYDVRAFKRVKKDGAFGELETEVGLQFLPDKTRSKSPHIELTLYESGVSVVGTQDNEDKLKSDLEIGKKLFHSIDVQIANSADRRDYRQAKKIARRRGGLALLATVGAIAGGTIGIIKSELFDGQPEKFDREGYVLPGGAAGKVGESVTPAFSRELFKNDAFEVTHMPRVNHNVKEEGSFGEEGQAKYPHDNTVTPSDGLRSLILTSSKEGDNCRTIDVDNVDVDSQITAWTDFIGPGGTSRASELRIRLDLASTGDGAQAEVTGCWYGQERNDSDDPRIVFDIK